jgi:hypothetical protein
MSILLHGDTVVVLEWYERAPTKGIRKHTSCFATASLTNDDGYTIFFNTV